MLDVLLAVANEQAADVGVTAVLRHVHVDALLVEVCAEGGGGHTDGCIASNSASRCRYGRRLPMPALDRCEAQMRAVLGEQFDRGMNQRCFVKLCSTMVRVARFDQRQLRLALGDDQRVVPVVAFGDVLGDQVEE